MRKNKEPVVITSKVGSSLLRMDCEDCGSRVLSSVNDTFCPICGIPFTDSGKATEVPIQANVAEKIKKVLVCATCDNVLHTDMNEEPSYLSAILYCPVCGSAEVNACDKVEEGCDKVEECKVKEDEEEAASDMEEEVEEEVQDKLEACLLSFPELQWLLFKNGEPIVRLKKSSQPNESHGIFGTPKFFEIFQKRAAETSLMAATKEFGGEVLDSKAVLTATDIEDAVYERLQANVLPRFLDCVSLAIEGMTRNIYPDLSSELKAGFFDELRARGIKDPENVVEAAFDASGSKVFAALVAKAMELFNKPESIRAELKSTILATSKVRSGKPTPVSKEDLEAVEVGAKLTAGNVPFVGKSEVTQGAISDASIIQLRDRIGFSRRSA